MAFRHSHTPRGRGARCLKESVLPPGPTRTEALTDTPVAGPVTMSCAASNSFRAALITTDVSGAGGSVGRIFTSALVAVTLCANNGAGMAIHRRKPIVAINLSTDASLLDSSTFNS